MPYYFIGVYVARRHLKNLTTAIIAPKEMNNSLVSSNIQSMFKLSHKCVFYTLFQIKIWMQSMHCCWLMCLLSF